jgi:molybdate transport system substrate-binding protein
LSELISLKGIQIAGPLPVGVQVTTVFAGAVCARSSQPDQALVLLRDLADTGHDALRRRHGMAPV